MKCPICKKEIENLIFSAKVEVFGKLRSQDDFDITEYGDWSEEIFDCPECSATLFTDSETAKSFFVDEEAEARADNKMHEIAEAENQEQFCN